MANRLHTTTPETAYLLGTLPEQERARLEYEFFTNDEKFQELELAEDDLIDAYVRNELNPAEQQQFRERLLIIPRIVERVDFARALAERTSVPVPRSQEAVQPGFPSTVHRKPKPRWWEWLFGSGPKRLLIAAYAVLVLVGGVLAGGWFRLLDVSARLAAERATMQRRKEDLDKQSTEQQARAEKLNSGLQQLAADREALEDRRRQAEPVPASLASTLSFLLMPGGSRGAGAVSNLKFAPDAQTAKLKLLLAKAEYRSYNVTVKTPDGRLVITKKGVKPRKTGSGSIVAISVPVHRLPPGDYVAYVAGLTSTGQAEGVDDYSFRVLKNRK
jgi:hypothetical protein